MASVSPESVKALYDHVCESYHAVDDFRMKLLGLLPVATGTGVFLLLSGKAELIGGNSAGQVPEALGAIGIFGALFTFGFFTHELFGIKKCHYLIEAGRRLEAALASGGSFGPAPVMQQAFSTNHSRQASSTQLVWLPGYSSLCSLRRRRLGFLLQRQAQSS
jgi:hypothetical protein